MTGPLTPEQVASIIGHAAVSDLNTGATYELGAKPDSASLFFDWFRAGDYLIQLRLDFSAPDVHGNPTLDADFIDPATRKHDHSMRIDPAHHTASAGASGPRTYDWTFEDATLRFTVAIAWSVSGSATATSAAFATATVIHPDGSREDHGPSSPKDGRSGP
jgi:hypothetical protein